MIPRVASVLVLAALAMLEPIAPASALETGLEKRQEPASGAATRQPAFAALPDPDGDLLPIPVEPEVIARDEHGHVTVRITRLREKLVIDGRLDEATYKQVRSMSDFIQQEPHEGQPATEKTEAWLFYDDQAVYISAICWQDPALRMVANDMRRDGQNIFQNDNFGVMLDTFNDKRNGFLFQTNPIGGLSESQMNDEGNNFNRDWNTVWDVKTQRSDQGWTLEMVIPLKSLRYPRGRYQVWGINLRRIVQAKVERSYMTRIPASAGPRGIARVSLAATMVGLEIGGGNRPLEVKPFILGGVSSDREQNPPVENDIDLKYGVDVKTSVTQGLVFDLTANTDFAQVEEDEAQVNLTRFSVFFPEKREFFLEGQGIFSFGGVQAGGFGGGPPSDTPVLFFSRRIGLEEYNDDEQEVVGIQAGGRLTGRAGPYTVGLLGIRQDKADLAGLPETNFGVVRVRRDILRRSNVGFISTYRSAAVDSPGSNTVVGADAYFAFYENVFVNAYLARSFTEGRDGDDLSYRGRFEYSADKYGAELEYLNVGEDFNPEVGFLRRENFKRSAVQLRYSPRPAGSRLVRKWGVEPSFEYITGGDHALETQQAQLGSRIEFTNGDEFGVDVENNVEVLDEPFDITDDILIPVGSYRFNNLRVSYELGPQRPVTGWMTVQHGGFYDGMRTETRFRGRVEISSRLSVEPNISLSWVDLPWGSFIAELYGARVTATLSPRMAVGALLQYSSQDDSVSASARLNWEYRPGSNLFVVYTEGRDTQGDDFPYFLQNRSFVVKLTRLFRF